MRFLLLFLLVSTSAIAQGNLDAKLRAKAGGLGLSQRSYRMQDSVAVNVTLPAALSLRVVHVADIASLTALSGANVFSVTVRDKTRGGLFVYDATATTYDNGITFPAQGGGGFVRIFWGEIYAAWFDAKGDGSTDDYNAIQAAIDAAYNYRYLAGIGQVGQNVRLGVGRYKIGNAKRIVLPNRVALFGMAPRLSELYINSGFKVTAADTIVVEASNKLKTGGKTNIFHTKLSNLSINLNGATGVVGFYSEEINEGSGLFNVAFTNIQYRGASIYAPTPSTGFGPQNFSIRDCEFIFNNAETSTSRGVWIDLNGATFQSLANNSYVGKNTTAYGAEIGKASGYGIADSHVESLARGFSIGTNGTSFGFRIAGIDAQVNMGATVYFGGVTDTYSYSLQGIRSAGSGFAVQDFRNQPTGRTNIAGPLALYTVGAETYSTAVARSITCSNTSYNRSFFRTSTVAPTTADVGSGQWVIWKETTTNTTKMYINDGGTIKASAAFN